MSYDNSLAERIRASLKRRRGFAEKKMFGGVCFLLNGNVCIGVWKKSLIARVGERAYPDALKEPFVREFDITGRAMTGWIVVDSDGLTEADDLTRWIDHSIAFVKTLAKK
jgi:hypothetical protein